MLFLERKRDFERPLKVINTSFDIALNVPIKKYTEWYGSSEVEDDDDEEEDEEDGKDEDR